jgi:hypothetical protein
MRGRPPVEVRPDAAEFIRDEGGCVYVWLDGAEMRHVRRHPPHHVVNWSEFQTGKVRLFVDPGIPEPSKWVVVLHHLPYPHLDVLPDGKPPHTPFDFPGFIQGP